MKNRELGEEKQKDSAVGLLPAGLGAGETAMNVTDECDAVGALEEVAPLLTHRMM